MSHSRTWGRMSGDGTQLSSSCDEPWFHRHACGQKENAAVWLELNWTPMVAAATRTMWAGPAAKPSTKARRRKPAELARARCTVASVQASELRPDVHGNSQEPN